MAGNWKTNKRGDHYQPRSKLHAHVNSKAEDEARYSGSKMSEREILIRKMKERGYSQKAASEYADSLAPFYTPDDKAAAIFNKLSMPAIRDLIEKAENYTGQTISFYATPRDYDDLGPNGKSAIRHYFRHRGLLPLEL